MDCCSSINVFALMIKPSKQFVVDFNKLMRYYECTADDAKIERQWLEDNPNRLKEIENSYRLMAEKIDNQ